MKKLLLICMCCVMVAPAVWGQTQNGPAKPGILGYLDPHTGAFRPVPSEESPDANALTTFTGTITVTLTITLKTTALTNITCSEEVTVLDAAATTPRFFAESDSVTAHWNGGHTDVQAVDTLRLGPGNPIQRQHEHQLLGFRNNKHRAATAHQFPLST